MPDTDWSQVLAFTVSPLELFVRGTLSFFFLFAMFRFIVRRDTGTLGPSDLLVLVIIADAAQNAMAGDYQSVPDGFVLIATIIGWSYVLNWLSFRYRLIRRVMLPRPLCIVKDGVKQDTALRQELIADEELAEILREHGIADIREVHRAYLEPDGQATVIRRRGQQEDGGKRRPAL
jgi:uncharacterized membrane protein YcaP (DUF421 family)